MHFYFFVCLMCLLSPGAVSACSRVASAAASTAFALAASFLHAPSASFARHLYCHGRHVPIGRYLPAPLPPHPDPHAPVRHSPLSKPNRRMLTAPTRAP